MKKFFVLILMTICVLNISAIEYLRLGSNAEFNAYTFDGQYYLILSFNDDGKNRLTNFTVVKFQLADGSILTLHGTNASSSIESGSTSFYNGFGFAYSIGGSDEKHYAILPITEEQIERLKIGIDKVAINTIPEVYKRSKWSGKKNFGQLLYNEFKFRKFLTCQF